MDVTVLRPSQGRLTTSVYRKPTHLGRYLAFGSHHPSTVKRSVVSSLASRALAVTSDDVDITIELDHICSELETNGYPKHFVQRELKRAQKR